MKVHQYRVWRLSSSIKSFRVGPVEVRPMENLLAGPAGEQRVGPRAMDVLTRLAQAGESVVPRDDLLSEVWQGRVVVDEALSRCISEIRQAFDACGGDPGLVATVRGRGYHLTAPVSFDLVVGEAAPARHQPASRRAQTGRWATAVGGIFLLGLLGIAAWQSRQQSPPTARDLPRISVAAFENLSGDAAREGFTRALALELQARLAGADDLVVLATPPPAQTAVAGLSTLREPGPGAHYVLSGSLSSTGGDSSNLALALNGPEQRVLEGEVLSFSAGRNRQRAMGEAVNRVRQALGLPPEAAPACRWSADSKAMELYFQGRAAVQARREDNLRQGIDRLQQALALDPDFGQALATLAQAYELLPHYLETRDRALIERAFARYRPLAKATAEKALQRCDSLGEAWYVLRRAPGYDGDNAWIRNRLSAAHAVSLEPNNDDLLRFLADYLEMTGMLQAAHAQFERAWIVNPHNARTLNNYALFLANRGEWQKALELDASGRAIQGYQTPFARQNIAMRRGDWDAARQQVREQTSAPPLIGDAMTAVIDGLEQPTAMPAARQPVRAVYESGFPGAINFLVFFGSLTGDLDYLFQALARDGQEVWMPALWAPETAPLRTDPRINKLFEQLGLIQYWQRFGAPDLCRLQESELRCQA